MAERVYEYPIPTKRKPAVITSNAVFVPIEEYEGMVIKASDVCTDVPDKVWKVGMDSMMTCGTCHTTHWGSDCQNTECVKGKEAIAIEERWKNDRR